MQQQGRRDHHTWFSYRTRSRLIMTGMGVLLVAAWQVAVALTCGAGLFDVIPVWRAAAHGQPIKGLPGGQDAEPTTVLITWAVSFVLLLSVFIGGWVWWLLRRGQKPRAGKGMATKKQVSTTVGEQRVRERAARSMPSMTKQQINRAPVEQLGLLLGKHQGSGQNIVLSFDDLVCILGPSGAGKSTGLMTPAALEAPGALVLTSNEVSIIDQIAATRGKHGRVWVFDLLNRAEWPHPMVWDPVAGCEEGATAVARAKAFVAGCAADGTDATNTGFFKANAEMALRAMLHAAALDGRDMTDVLAWTGSLARGAKPPRDILRDSTDPRCEKAWESQLEAVATGAEETVGSSRNTLAQVVDALTLQSVMRWLRPRDGAHAFNAAEFVRSGDTLVLLSDDSSATNVGPLCTMLFQEVVDSIKAWAPFTPHGLLDPPLRIVGDEIANIAPIDKLPEMTTELRKLGVQVILAFQSDEQPVARWGQHRGRILLEQMSAEIVLPGLKSVTALNRYSELAGKTEVWERSVNTSADGEFTGAGGQLHERAVLRSDEVRTMSDGEALLVWRNMPATKITLTPWMQRPYAAQVTADIDRSRQDRRDARARRLDETGVQS